MIFFAFSGLVLVFGFVLFFGAPYLPTQRKQLEIGLDLMNLKRGEIMYELGCGDGKVLKVAASRGINVIGYELNPILVLVAKINTFRYRQNVRVIWGNFWRADISDADGVYVFLLDRFMKRLDKKIQSGTQKPVKLVSYAFKVPGRKIKACKSGMYLYQYGPKV